MPYSLCGLVNEFASCFEMVDSWVTNQDETKHLSVPLTVKGLKNIKDNRVFFFFFQKDK